jgi:hypothetical protein
VTTPAWSAPQNGLPGNLDATNASAQVNQFLGTHGITPIYDGAQILTPGGNNNFTWVTYGNAADLDQSFVLSGTSIGRVVLPVQPNGNGADMLVSLYPDNGSGSPNTAGGALAATVVPAAVINQLAAPDGLASGGPLAIGKYNAAYCTSGVTIAPYPVPAISTSGSMAAAAFASSGSYLVSVGGLDPATAGAVTGVYVFEYLGGGVLAPPVPQPQLPVGIANGGSAIAGGFLVLMGGYIGAAGSGSTANVYAASWDANTGTVGSWSSQAALPAVSITASATGYGDYVYYVGGQNGAVSLTAVYYALVNNGQISSWTSGPPLPVGLAYAFTAAVNGWLIVVGGLTTTPTIVNTMYYAPINADGSYGPWQVGPPIPFGNDTFSDGFDITVADDLIVIIGGTAPGGLSIKNIQVMAVTPDGPSDNWVVSNWVGTRLMVVNAVATGGGNYDIICINFSAVPTQTEFSQLVSVPLISVPLPATGLTNGGTYHVVLQQHQTASAADYLAWGVLDSALPLDAKSSTRHSGTWSAVTGYSIPMTVYNNATGSGNVRHLVEDPNAYNVNQRWTTLLYNNADLLIGVLEATLNPNPPLNSNPTFTSGVSPWTPTGGTFVQSAVQTHGGFPFSGLLTPNGVAAQAFASSELLPVQQGGGPFYGVSSWYLADGWFYSTPGTANFSFSVAWYDRLGTLLSTSSSTITLAAATWTHVQNYVEAPAGAAQAQLVPTEGGTPANTKLLYVSDAYLIQSWENVGSFCSAATVDYHAGPWPPTGVTQLL